MCLGVERARRASWPAASCLVAHMAVRQVPFGQLEHVIAASTVGKSTCHHAARTSRVLRVTGELHWFAITQRQTRLQLRDKFASWIAPAEACSQGPLAEDLMVRTSEAP